MNDRFAGCVPRDELKRQMYTAGIEETRQLQVVGDIVIVTTLRA